MGLYGCVGTTTRECQSLTLATAALEVYVRRAYRAYSLLSIDYDEGDADEGDAPNAVTWTFNLGQSRSPPATPMLRRE